MRVAILFLVATLAFGWISSCGVGGGHVGVGVNPDLVVTITNKPGGIPQGTSLVFNATVSGDPSNKGVTWSLTPGNEEGTLTNLSPFSVTYNAPATPPFPFNQITLFAISVSDPFNGDTEVFSVTVPGLTTTITNKISTINAGGQPVTLNVTVANDPRNAGVNWSIEQRDGFQRLIHATGYLPILTLQHAVNSGEFDNGPHRIRPGFLHNSLRPAESIQRRSSPIGFHSHIPIRGGNRCQVAVRFSHYGQIKEPIR